jgi:hypothetical protein
MRAQAVARAFPESAALLKAAGGSLFSTTGDFQTQLPNLLLLVPSPSRFHRCSKKKNGAGDGRRRSSF